MESIQHSQQTSCNVFYHTLVMLLHYLGKLKRCIFAANIEQNAKNMHWFLHAHILTALTYSLTYLLTYYLLIYYFNLWFLLNILLNNTQFYVNRSAYWQRFCTLVMWHYTISREDYTFTLDQIWGHQTAQTSIWFNIYYNIWGVIQHRVFLVVCA